MLQEIALALITLSGLFSKDSLRGVTRTCLPRHRELAVTKCAISVTSSPREMTERRKVYFSSWFRRFPSLLAPSVTAGLWAGRHRRTKLFLSCQPGSRNRTRRDQDKSVLLSHLLSSTNSLFSMMFVLQRIKPPNSLSALMIQLSLGD